MTVESRGKSISGARNGRYLVDVAFYSAAQAVASLLMLLYVFVTARLLGKNEFGLFQALMGLFGILNVYGTPLNIAAVHVVGQACSEARDAVLGRFVLIGLAIGVCVACILLVASPVLGQTLHCDSILPFLSLAVFVIACSVLTVLYGGLQGQNRYMFFSLTKMAESAAIPCIGIVLMLLHSGASGAIAGYACAMSLAILFLLVRKGLCSFRKPAESAGHPFKDIAPLMSVLAVLLFINDFPMVVARSRMSADDAGLFAAIFSLRNMAFPFAFAIAVPLYSRQVSGLTEDHLLLKSLLLTGALSAALVTVAVFGGEFLISTAFGGGYLESARYFPLYCCGLGLHALCTVLMLSMARGFGRSLLFIVVPVLIVGSLMFVRDCTIDKIILAQVAALMCCIAMSLWRGCRGHGHEPQAIRSD